MLWRLSPRHPELFPDPALAEPSGLLAVGGDLSPRRLIAAYRAGIFPWYDKASPLLWWSPDPRCVILPETFRLPSSLRWVLNSRRFAITFDTAFARVIRRCADSPRPAPPCAAREDGRETAQDNGSDSGGGNAGQEDTAGGTWLLPDMIAAYERLHQLGLAHSVEVWEDGELAGGLYGVALGRAFFGESMFHARPNASKAALASLAARLWAAGATLLDCQMPTPHILRFGAVLLPRPDFLRRLAMAVAEGPALFC